MLYTFYTSTIHFFLFEKPYVAFFSMESQKNSYNAMCLILSSNCFAPFPWNNLPLMPERRFVRRCGDIFRSAQISEGMQCSLVNRQTRRSWLVRLIFSFVISVWKAGVCFDVSSKKHSHSVADGCFALAANL